MKTYNMIVGLPKVFPPKGFFKGRVLGKYHRAHFDIGKRGDHRTY
jgi:hypothetical protein